MVSSLPCFSFDSNPLVVDCILCPLVERVQELAEDQVRVHTNSSKSDHDSDGYECPFDWYIFCI